MITLTNLTQINIANGNTTFLFALSPDVDNTTLNWSSGGGTGFWIRPLEYSSAAYAPYINITYTSPDGTPDSITNLTNQTIMDCGIINWNWTNPIENFTHVMIYKNGTFFHNVTTPYDTWTGLQGNLSYTISTRTCDGFCSNVWVNSTITPCPDAPLSLNFYAYGDSITGAAYYYLKQMLDTHNATATYSHNVDGSGQYASWGLTNWATHPGSPYPNNVYVMFGMNDKHYGVPVATTALNLRGIYTNFTTVGSNTTILIETLAEDGQGDWSTYENQTARINYIENYFNSNSVPYIRIYDAIDSIPNNCVPNEVNMTLMGDSRHPNAEGHRLMGEYIWNNTCIGVNITPTPTPTPTPTSTPTPILPMCSNSTGNLSLSLKSYGSDYFEFQWNQSILQLAFDSIIQSGLDLNATSIIFHDIAKGSYHTVKIYNQTEYGEIACTMPLDAVVWTPDINPSVEGSTDLSWLMWVGAGLLIIFVLFRRS